MKFNKSGQLLLVSAASLLVAGLVTACGTSTVDFVFVASSKAAGTDNYGQLNVFEVNSVSGTMRQIPTSPFPSGGRNPIAEAVSTDYADLYVVNQDDNTIVQFVIGNDGKLYPHNTVNTPGIYPLAVAVQGSNLFVVDTYEPLPICSPAAPCSGSIAVFPIVPATSNAVSELGTPATNGSLSYLPLCLSGYSYLGNSWVCNASGSTDVMVPTAVSVLASGSYAYVTAYDSSVTPSVGYVFGFAVGSGGTLTPLNGGAPPVAAGTHPSAIAGDPSSKYVYVTDSTNGNVRGFAVQSGALSPLSGSPFPAGNQPSSITVDPAGGFAYVANAEDSTVTAYSITNGALTRIGTYATGSQPVAIGIDPSTNHFVYTANFLGSNVSGFQLSATDGSLINTQNTPYASNALPTAIAAVPHGSPKQ
jgi:6-phosphogluconolactonase (cycloisomerase 2 family)